mmetsp:Transcript_31927/g.42152  ORF Transcript_31927/g.42152 Transcript_31927/m.42152 type:complete len:197 (+) Transcript_31927:72-662(+)
MEANAEEANRAKELGREYLRKNQFGKAIKFLSISNRLNPNPDTRQILNSAKAGAARLRGQCSTNYSSTTAQQPSQSSTSPSDWNSRQFQPLVAMFQNYYQAFLEWRRHFGVEALFNRLGTYVLPEYRRPLMIMFYVIIFLVIYRLFFAKASVLSTGLPGDIYFSSPGFTFSCPIVSSLLFSFVVNHFARAWNNNRQ